MSTLKEQAGDEALARQLQAEDISEGELEDESEGFPSADDAGEEKSTDTQAPPLAKGRQSAKGGHPRGDIRHQDGNLMWYDPECQKWRHAVFHSQIRERLIADASRRGTYTHPRAAGRGSDVTSYHPDQRDWGFERNQRPAILFKIYPPSTSDKKPGKWVTEDGSVVIDLYRNPVLKYTHLPDTISSKAEGFLLEAFCRVNREITIFDIRARMVDNPRDPDQPWNGEGKDPIRAVTLGMSMNRFRRLAACIPWSRQSGHALVAWVEKKIPAWCISINSTRGFRDLERHEWLEMELLNAGTRASSSANDISDDRHTKRREKVRQSLEDAKEKFFGRTHDVDFVDEIEKTEDQMEGCMQEIDNGVEDLRSVVPTTATQAQLIQNLLLPSRMRFQDFTSQEAPVTNHGQSYIDQYRNIREDVMEWSIDHDCDDIFPDLVGLRSFTVDRLLWNLNPGAAYLDGRHEWKSMLLDVKAQLEAKQRR